MIHPNPDRLSGGGLTASPRFSATAAVSADDKVELIDLVRRAEAGEAPAQSELVRRYTRRVAGFVRAIIRQPEAVEDVTQIVFIKMFRRLSRLRDPAVFESWLFTLARNSGLDFIRRRNCRPSTVAIDDEVYQIADPSTSSAAVEILAALDRALARLTPIDRGLVTQFVAGDTYGEIAERTGLTLATVKVRLHRVRPFLRSWVGEMTDTRQRGTKGWRAASANHKGSDAWSGGRIAA